MHTSAQSLKIQGGKVAELNVAFKGVSMPVNVYLVKPQKAEPFALCVCFEDTPIEIQLSIDKDLHGDWIDMHDRSHELAGLIGPMIENKLKPRLLN